MSLYLAATPIGNDGDASPRLRELLTSADIIAAEDTRRAKTLCARLGIEPRGKFTSFFEHNEEARADQLIEDSRTLTVLMISDAGMPAISDPGFVLVQRAHAAGVAAHIVPGPSAVLTALAASGISPARFSFEGFAPRKDGERRTFFEQLATRTSTTIFFDSPRRLAATLAVMEEVWGGERTICVARELTKTHEEIVCGSVQSVRDHFREEVRGEIVVVAEGVKEVEHKEGDERSLNILLTVMKELTGKGMRAKDAAGFAAEYSQQLTGVKMRKNDLYRALLEEENGV